MYIVSVLVLAAAASLDCLIIGFNYGVKGVRIGNVSNAFLSLVCFVGTFLSMLLGRLAGCFLNASWGEALGAALLLILGGYMLCSALWPRKTAARQQYSENPEMVDKDQSKVIELRESLLIGLLLCVNNIGIGIGGGMTGIPVLLTPAACAVFSFLFIKLGCHVGGRVENPRLATLLETLSAGLIMALGLSGLAGAL